MDSNFRRFLAFLLVLFPVSALATPQPTRAAPAESGRVVTIPAGEPIPVQNDLTVDLVPGTYPAPGSLRGVSNFSIVGQPGSIIQGGGVIISIDPDCGNINFSGFTIKAAPGSPGVVCGINIYGSGITIKNVDFDASLSDGFMMFGPFANGAEAGGVTFDHCTFGLINAYSGYLVDARHLTISDCKFTGTLTQHILRGFGQKILLKHSIFPMGFNINGGDWSVVGCTVGHHGATTQGIWIGPPGENAGQPNDILIKDLILIDCPIGLHPPCSNITIDGVRASVDEKWIAPNPLVYINDARNGKIVSGVKILNFTAVNPLKTGGLAYIGKGAVSIRGTNWKYVAPNLACPPWQQQGAWRSGDASPDFILTSSTIPTTKQGYVAWVNGKGLKAEDHDAMMQANNCYLPFGKKPDDMPDDPTTQPAEEETTTAPSTTQPSATQP